MIGESVLPYLITFLKSNPSFVSTIINSLFYLIVYYGIARFGVPDKYLTYLFKGSKKLREEIVDRIKKHEEELQAVKEGKKDE